MIACLELQIQTWERLMLIYITNREVADMPVSRPKTISVKKIGQGLSKRKEKGKPVFLTGLASDDYSRVRFYPPGSEPDLFDQVEASEYKRKPWLVFLHGFHQDPWETVEKARLLETIHGVNVVLFAWPSRPRPVNAFDVDNILDELTEYIKNPVFAVRPSLKGILLGETIKLLKDFAGNYRPARRNAEKSTTDFYAALELLKKHLLPKIRKNQLNLVVHSMGNYLLQKTLEHNNGLPLAFHNIVSHQADVKASNHASWMPMLSAYSQHRLYITVNVLDYVLAASNMLHKINGVRDRERLGHSVRIKPDGIYQGYIQNTAQYLDFTDGYGVDVKHEIFTCEGTDIDDAVISAESGKVDQNVVDLLGRIFRGERDRLPASRGKSLNGFSMMPTLPRVYKPQWIVEDQDLCGDERHICMITSLGEFDDPYTQETEYDADFDEDW